MNQKDFISQSAMKNATALLSAGETDISSIVMRSVATAVALSKRLVLDGYVEK